ncbi:MAG: HAMP domain-containing sensor histidine kinase [Acidobacteriota bacterium]
MALRTRLFLVFGALVALLVLAQWWMVRSLTRDLDTEVDSLALTVGSSMAWAFGDGGDNEVIELSHGDLQSKIEIAMSAVDQAALAESSVTVLPVDVAGKDIRVDASSVRYLFLQDDGAEVTETVVGDDSSAGGVSPGGTPKMKVRVEHGPNARFLRIERPGGVHRVEIPGGGVEDRLETFRRQLLTGSGVLLALGLLVAGVVAHRVSAPLRRLAAASARVGDGELGVQVEADDGDPEVRRTLVAWNRMSSRLEALDRRARRLAEERHLGEIGDVARGLAHTLRNPLNALGLSVDALAGLAGAGAPGASGVGDPRGEDAAADLADSARRQIRRLDRGIRSMLALASPRADPSTHDPVDVTQLTRDVALEAIQDADRRVRVAVRGEDGEGALPGVEAELRAVIQALVVNAVEASDDGGEVEVKLTPRSGGGVRVEVADRGPGLPPSVRERLFTPHVSTKPNGSGMGLFLAHRIAGHRYGGSLALLDRDGGGSVARLDLGPRRTADAEVDRDRRLDPGGRP